MKEMYAIVGEYEFLLRRTTLSHVKRLQAATMLLQGIPQVYAKSKREVFVWPIPQQEITFIEKKISNMSHKCIEFPCKGCNKQYDAM